MQRAAHRQQRRGVVQGPEPHARMAEPSSTAPAARSSGPACGNCPWAPRSAKFWKSTPAACATACAFAALLPGGASTDFLDEEHLDVPMDFTEVQKAGSRLGTGTMIVLDDQTCPVGMVLEPGTLLRPGILRLVHALLERSGVGGAHPAGHGRRARPAGRPGEAGVSGTVSGRRATPSARWRPAPSSRCRARLKYFREDFERHITREALPLEIDDGEPVYIDNRSHTRWTPRQNLLHACLSLGFEPALLLLASGAWARWAPAASAPSSSSRTRTTRTGKIVMACMTPAAEGTRISIDDPEAVEFRARGHRRPDDESSRTIARSATRAASATCRT